MQVEQKETEHEQIRPQTQILENSDAYSLFVYALVFS